MSANSGVPVYTELDEQRFKIWFGRLEESYKSYVAAEEQNDTSLLESIKNTLKSDLESFPQWISSQKTTPVAKIVSSSNDMKMFLRHVAFPHVLTSYGKILDEICAPVMDESGIESASENVPTEEGSSGSSAVAVIPASVTAPVCCAAKVPRATLSVPMHTAPICSAPDKQETAVDDFFRGLAAGHGDGLVNLCKLADITHRINRAEEHDSQQVAHWIEHEVSRRDENSSSLTRREERLQFLRGEDSGQLLEHSVGKLKSQINVLNDRLALAVGEEDEARKAYEAAIQRRRSATQNISNLENYIDNVATHRELLKKVNDLRIEADKYNIESANKRVSMFRGLEKYVHTVREQFVQNRLASEMPAMFDNLANVFGQLMVSDKPANSAEEGGNSSGECKNGENVADGDKLSLFCAARVGLETIRIWRQLNLHIAQPTLLKPIEDFQSQLSAALATQQRPSITDAAAKDVFRTSDATVVLFFDHLQHDTPEDHVEAQSRVLTCLKMLTEHLVDDPPHARMDVDADAEGANGDGGAVRKPRTMQLLNCNDILAPPVWCLPLAHSPQYLAQLWRLAEEAFSGDLYVPLEFDTEWISEDPYHSNSEDESHKRNRNPSATGNLMKSVDFEEPWADAMDDAQKEAFTRLLTPVPSDHLVAKVIKRMDAKAAAKAVRSSKIAPPRVRADERAGPSAPAPAAVTFQPPAVVSEGVAVKTPMGPGNVLQNFRRDGIVSVKLGWGAVGHFRRECVEFPALAPVPNTGGQAKGERPSLSAAQAFYVTGSAGRFIHNDMEVHNTMSRLITLVRVQRIIGDFVGINHANLSLYMHGRTSTGLTKTIEATIMRWLEKFDEHKLADVLDQAESAAQAGMPMDPKDFIRLFNTAAMPPGQVSTVRSDFANGAAPVVHKSSAPAAPARDRTKASIPHASSSSSLSVVSTAHAASRAAPPATSSLNSAPAPPMPPSPVPVRAASPEVQEVPVKPKQERTKSTTDVRTLAKYTKDGETLRELMASIMKTLKLSQGSIANEYYRNFRYETSQGGVSAWFHFRGNSGTFDGMNHCALMWVDDHKQHLTEEEQQVFAEVNKRMSQHSPGRPHPERSNTPVTLPSREPMEAEKAAEATALVPAVAAEPAAAAGSEAPAAEAMVCDDAQDVDVVAWNTIEPLPLPVTPEDIGMPVSREESTMEVESTAVTANRAVSDDEDGQDADGEGSGSSSDDDSDADSASPKKPATEMAHDAPPQMTTQMSSEQSSLPSVSDTSGTHMIRPTDSLSMKLAVSRQIGSELFAAGQSSSTDGATGASAADVVVKSEAGDGAEGGSAAPSSELPAPLGVIRTIEDLHSSVVYEMNRRKVSQSRAAVEANLRDLGMGQPALSKFLSVATINNNERGKLFSGGMVRWVNYSRTQPPAEGWDPEQMPAYRAPNRPKVTSAATSSTMSEPWTKGFTSAGAMSAGDDSADEHSLRGDLDIKAETSRSSARPSGSAGGVENTEERLTCGLCGKLSTEFANNKSFHMHLAWCYRRKGQSRPPADQFLKTGGTVVEWDPSGSKKRKSVDGQGDAQKRSRPASDPSRAQPSADAMKDTYVVAADSFAPGHHYETCEVCRDAGDVILCDSCPCIYHLRCADVDSVPEGNWYCPKCVESGASNCDALSEERKSDPGLVESWILVYSDALHRWRKAVVTALHPERRGTVLVKWWRSDGKGGKSNWVDIARVNILTAIPERASIQPSRSRGSSHITAPPASAGSRERSSTVRFDPATDKKSSAHARFKDGHGMMLMDGENSGSVPPLVRASAAGVGGVAALRDGEYADGKTSTNVSGAGMSDTYISSNSLKAALCAAGSGCRAVDIALCNENTNVFACTRPPGHHAGRYGCTSGCLSTGFCMLNNAAIAAIYARVRWGLERVAVVDIDVHFGNGTAELLRNDPNAFFASVHMIYGEDNDGMKTESAKRIRAEPSAEAETKKKTPAAASLGFYPARMGLTEVTNTYVSVGVYPTHDSARLRNTDGVRRRKKPVVASYDSDSSEEVTGEVAAEEEVPEEQPVEEGMDIDAPSTVAEETSATESSSAAKPAASGKRGGEGSRRPFIGAEGFLRALQDVIIPQMEKFNPQLLVISAGFDGYISDPLGGQLCLSLEDYKTATKMLMSSMDRIKAAERDPSVITGKVISLLEGGYDTSPFTLGLAKCVDAHVVALQEG